MTQIIFRADATPRMGTGHVMRCMALAQAAQNQGFWVKFVTRVQVPWVRERLHAEGLSFEELGDSVPLEESPAALLEQLGQEDGARAGTWVVLDGYHFSCKCQQAVRNAGYRLLVIDDYAHLSEYSCDVLLNQNLGSETLSYTGDIGSKLLGLRYALLRHEFCEARGRLNLVIRNTPPRNILVTLGGGDFIEFLELIARCMSFPAMVGCSVRVIQGAMETARIKQAFADCPAKLEILPRVSDMPELLLNTDLCVTAGGSTCWELCCLNVPFLVIKTAVNQRNIVDHLGNNGMLFSKKAFQRAVISRVSVETDSSTPCLSIDGNGAQRILAAMLKICEIGSQMEMRLATIEDKKFIFDVVNSDLVRKMSFDSHYISKNEHELWYGEALKKNIPFYIFSLKDIRVGYVRFIHGGPTANCDAILTIALDQAFRKKGLGQKMVQMACAAVLKGGIKKVWAYVKKENQASVKLFSKCGFTLEECQEYRGVDVFTYSLEQR